MCGIIGISSNKSVSSSIINSLKKLEYRGYDSAGIATLSDGFINEVKSEGRVENLENNFDLKNLSGNIGIGHVRWATHGVPNSVNAHPHSSENVSVVHNGIIENSTLLKKYLLSKGHKFKSQTDTEVIVHLITENLKTTELQEAITKTLKQLHGSFALGIIFKDMPDLIIGARRGSPLAVGYGPNENYLGSDSYALKSMTNKITYLEDGEFCFIKKDEVNFFNEEGIKINKKVLELSTDQQNYDKDGLTARCGSLIPKLLNDLNSIKHYSAPPPKSLGTEWLDGTFTQIIENYADEGANDVIHTVTAHIADQIVRSLNSLRVNSVMITGGGALNLFLIELIRAKFRGNIILPERELIEYKEAIIFAFLGALNLDNSVNTIPSVTGATNAVIGGVKHLP